MSPEEDCEKGGRLELYDLLRLLDPKLSHAIPKCAGRESKTFCCAAFASYLPVTLFQGLKNMRLFDIPERA